MDNSSDEQKGIPDSLVDSLVNDVLRKNNLDPTKVKGHLSGDQKRMLQELFSDLHEQVEAYVNKPKLKRKRSKSQKKMRKKNKKRTPFDRCSFSFYGQVLIPQCFRQLCIPKDLQADNLKPYKLPLKWIIEPLLLFHFSR